MRASAGRASVGIVLVCSLVAGAAFGHERGEKHGRKSARPQEVKISVTQAGFEPATVAVKKGLPIVLVITRKTDQTCATQAVFPSIERTVDLPLNKSVRVALPAQSAGHLSYACGMGMFHGVLVVQ